MRNIYVNHCLVASLAVSVDRHVSAFRLGRVGRSRMADVRTEREPDEQSATHQSPFRHVNWTLTHAAYTPWRRLNVLWVLRGLTKYDRLLHDYAGNYRPARCCPNDSGHPRSYTFVWVAPDRAK